MHPAQFSQKEETAMTIRPTTNGHHPPEYISSSRKAALLKEIEKYPGIKDIKHKSPGKDRKAKITKSAMTVLPGIVIDEGKKRIRFTDVMLPGFICVVSATGACTFYHQWTDKKGKRHFNKIGRFPGISPDIARDIILARNELIARGVDPNDDENDIPCIADFIVSEILPKLAEWYSKPATPRSQITKWVLQFFSGKNNKPLNEMTRRDVVRFIEWVADNCSTTTANRCKALLSAIMNRALDLEYVDRNICHGVKGYRECDSRTRILTEDEYLRLVQAVI